MDERLESVLNASTPVRSATCSADAGGSPANQSSLYASSLASTAPATRDRAAASSRNAGGAVTAVGLFGVLSHSSASRSQSSASRSGSQPRSAVSGSSTTSAPAN